ncbi:MAG: hypothetical protein E6R13_10255 [Spirochaetes bacterium]|nr:MAG: hypothetical protein E6R13_10255 [Spirochaetota bacterium]
MTEKYYTPDITEFHVGFEYEELEQGEWRKTTSDGSDIYHIGKYYIKENKIRVKYLDQSDIESLGWKMVWNDSHGTDYTFNDWQINISVNGNYLQLFKGKAPYFRGIIKNKSELNKLMHQLNII